MKAQWGRAEVPSESASLAQGAEVFATSAPILDSQVLDTGGQGRTAVLHKPTPVPVPEFDDSELDTAVIASTPAQTQVFVDDSGRRGRWMRVAGAAVTVLCALYIGIVAVGISQTAVGPLADVPVGNNGTIAGFPGDDGTVPGLLQNTGSERAVGQGGHVAVPKARPVTAAARKTPAAVATTTAKPRMTATPATGKPVSATTAKPTDPKTGSGSTTGSGTPTTGTSQSGGSDGKGDGSSSSGSSDKSSGKSDKSSDKSSSKSSDKSSDKSGKSSDKAGKTSSDSDTKAA